jgi:hypothetical protein
MADQPITVTVGQRVILLDGNHSKNLRTTDGTVVKVARVWIEVLPEGLPDDPNGWNRRRYRLDTQTDGTPYSYAPRFYTLEQWDERERRDAAATFLREQGIDLRWESPWRGREHELAELLRPHVPAPEASA